MSKNKSLALDETKFVTYGGKYTLELTPVSPFSLDDARARAFKAHPEPECPTYEEETAAGEKLSIKIDDEAVVQYPQLKEAWEAYKAALAECSAAVNMEILDVCVLEGCASTPDEAWVENRRKRYGDIVPTDPDELKIYWVRREVLRRPSDIGEFTRMVMELSEMTDSKIKAVEAQFRSPLGESERTDDQGTEE